MYEDDPQDLIFDILAETIFPDHPLGRATLGRAEVVRNATREQLLGFHASRYRPANVVIAAAGNVEHDDVVAWAQEALGGAGAHAEDGAHAAASTPPRPGGGITRFRVRDTEQYHLTLGGPAIARDDERRFALRVLDSILGGTSSSRLFQAVREERGLAYSVFTFHSLYAHIGQVGLYVGTRPENLAEVGEVLAAELERIRSEPVSAEELERAKDNAKGRVVLALESTAARMERLGGNLLAAMPILALDETLERIDAVDAAAVGQIAAELLAPERLSAAAIGPDEDLFRTAVAPLVPALSGTP